MGQNFYSKEINPEKPVEVDVIINVNVLDLIAACCEGGMVDEHVVKRLFDEEYTKHYISIDLCGRLPGRGITGRELLQENRAAMKFYQSLSEERVNRGRLEK